MKKKSIIFSLFVIFLVQYSCTESIITDPGFKDVKRISIYDFLVQNEADYSSFLQILRVGGIDKTLSAYNPNGINYTLFVPNNKAVDDFIKGNDQFTSLDDLLKDTIFNSALARYHVINVGVTTNEFPFGAFADSTLSGDFLSVNFIIETDTTYYKINNQAPVSKANFEVSNGYIHEISTMLEPITLNSFNWLKRNPDYSIFTAAIEVTGINNILDVDMKLKDQTLNPFTMLVEPDTVYYKRNINSIDDLLQEISPDRSDYTNSMNPLNLFVSYHILSESKFLNNLQDRATNYNTFADISLSINGLDRDIVINKGKEIFEPIIVNTDTTFVDYIGVYYDESNIITQSGPIHLIDQILKPQIPSRATVSFQFNEELALNSYRQKGGTFLLNNPQMFNYLVWEGADLFYVKSLDDSEKAYDDDYLQIDGNFTIIYNLPKIVQGKYSVTLRADASSQQNALITLYIDGNQLGGLIDLTKGATADSPYQDINVGTVDFKQYAGHSIQVKSLIPGRFKWDDISFKPL